MSKKLKRIKLDDEDVEEQINSDKEKQAEFEREQEEAIGLYTQPEGLPDHLTLTPREFRFVCNFIQTSKKNQSCIDAGYPQDNAHTTANRLLRLPKIMLEIERQRALLAIRHMKTQDDVAHYWWSVATVDLRDLNPTQPGCCRYCYGVDHEYQRTEGEFRERQRKHQIAQQKKPNIRDRVDFDEEGGPGFNKYFPPVSDCPECGGKGIIIAKPPGWMDDLPPEVSLLISGFKFKDGELEIKIRDDRGKAMENFQFLMGFVKSKKLVEVIDPTEMSDEQLESAIRRLEEWQKRKATPTLSFTPTGDAGAKVWSEDPKEEMD